MDIQEQIKVYLATQPEPKRADMESLNIRILQVLPTCKLWFLDGKDDNGKTVSNPNQLTKKRKKCPILKTTIVIEM
jgi:hypothetical protein